MPDQPHILFVRRADDAGPVRTLEDAGYRVSVARDARDALETLRATAVDCVVTNYEIPGPDGVAFLGALRMIETIETEYPDLPVIVFSELESHDMATEALERDVFDIVPKRTGTGSDQRLLRRIESALTRQETRNRARKQTRINRATRNVNQALIRSQSEREVDRRLVAELADSERYLSAAVATVDEDGVSVRAAATSRLRDADPHELRYTAPIEAAATSETPVVVDLEERDPDRDRAGALEHGTEMLAATRLAYRERDYGVLAVYTDRPRAFDEEERESISDLARNAALALHTIETREQLLRQTRELEERTERLERLARIISHELRNPLQTAIARVDLARESGDLDHLDVVTESHQDIERQVQNLVGLAKDGQSVDEPTAVSLTAIVETAWQRVGATEATLEIAGDRELLAVPDRLTELFENYFRGAIGARTDVTVGVGPIADGFYIEDDTGRSVDSAEELFDLRYDITDPGEGIEMRIVRSVLESHDWRWSIHEREDGKTRLSITGVGPN